MNPYASHQFVTTRAEAPGSPHEFIRYCRRCGCLDRGDPAEFPGLEYPNCQDV
jgi:hypothetical protein